MPRPPTSPVPPDRRFDGQSAESSSGEDAGFDASEEIKQAVRLVFAPHLEGPSGQGSNLWQTWRGILRSLLPLGAVSHGNQIEVMAEGDLVFESIWRAIEGARQEVLMTTYILEPDAVGRRTIQLLAEAAARGCQVTLVFDSFGSSDLGPGDLAELRGAGAVVHAFNPMWRWRRPLSRWVRIHQKILVVDGEVAFAGGMNVGAAYAGPKHGTGQFRDTHLRLEGPCVKELARLVHEAAQDGKAEPLEPAAEPSQRVATEDPAPDASGGASGVADEGCLVQILESNIRRHQRAIQRALRTTVQRSAEHCYLCTPYFVPPPRLNQALKRAARRGIDVRILTAGVSDVPAVRMASRHLYGDLLRAGVRVFEYQSASLHAKTMTVDGVYAAVGSFNLDYWSDRRNLEVNVSFLNVEMAQLIEEQFHADLAEAREVKLSNWSRRPLWQRLLHRIAYWLLSV